jgi:hypothetical protein
MTVITVASDLPAPAFKTCNYCQACWSDLDAFMQDPAVALVGYMPTFDDLVSGLFLFNHDCGTTLACRVGQFEHLYNGPIFRENRHGGECPGYCQHKSDFSPCPTQCSCAYVRDTLQIIQQWPKVKAI